MDSTLPAVAEELLREIKKAFQETSQVPDDLLLGLKFIFGPSAVPALDLVDQRSVTRVTSPSGRTAYQVLGSSGKLYTCYSSCHFCTCPAFGFTVLQKNESLLEFWLMRGIRKVAVVDAELQCELSQVSKCSGTVSLSLYCSAVCFSLSVLSRVWFIFSQQEPGGGGGKLTFFVVGINVACNHFATLPDLQVKP
ncbi:zinc finger SWIM domain-containing protein 7 isoform X2 [Rissa tridactyla]|nr:zinc finger SWIM domain-containing protein 7 isoform X2 [Rissa tridactyla]XP_054065319.1 zinc finger SWIM domain-containing protein 7 isoform X2 [Rissa tridactyla]